MAEVKFEGIENIVQKFEEIGDTSKLRGAVQKACALVERTAKQKAPKDTGALRNSIQSRVEESGEDIVGIVFTPLEYAPYVEYGTGLGAYKENGSGKGRKTPWLYEDEKTGKTIFTRGQDPKPYMRPALNENRKRIVEILKEGGQ